MAENPQAGEGLRTPARSRREELVPVGFHDPTIDYVFHKGPGFVPPPWNPRYPVEARKSLFGRDGGIGLPIGNLTSQFWANCYLDVLDQFARRSLGCRHYAVK